MSTLAIVVVLLAVDGGVTYLLMKKGKIKDANNNNIPDAVEEKVEAVVEKVEEVKVVVKKAKAKVEKAKEVVAEVQKVAEKVKKPATKKATTKAAKK